MDLTGSDILLKKMDLGPISISKPTHEVKIIQKPYNETTAHCLNTLDNITTMTSLFKNKMISEVFHFQASFIFFFPLLMSAIYFTLTCCVQQGL